MYIYLKSILLVFFFCLCQPLFSQKDDSKDLITVDLRIVAQGASHNFKDTKSGYFAIATITNSQDTTINFWIMNCSWPRDNWVTSNSIVYFESPGCDNNSVIRVELLPHKKIDFYGVLQGSDKKLSNNKVRLGFLYFSKFKDLFNPLGRDELKQVKKYWSNEVQLEDTLFTYRQD